MKIIKVTFSNGEVWQFPVNVVYMHIANYAYKNNWYPNLPIFAEVYTQVVKEYSELGELTDWLINNMNWSDLAREAQKVDQVAFDYEYAWLEMQQDNFEIVEEVYTFSEKRPEEGELIEVRYEDAQWLPCKYYEDGIAGILEHNDGDCTEIEEYIDGLQWRKLQ